MIQSVLSMSDLQILTGLSILISGFIQMRCGISRYHWNILVYLAWFSSLTPFGCLSFLRYYLSNHPGERTWRLAAMASIVIMLMVALVPTGSGETILRDGSAIICAFQYPSRRVSQDASFVNMVLSIVLLAIGLFLRVFKLSRRLTTNITNRIRNPFGQAATRFLFKVHAWSKAHEPSLRELRLLLAYRPLLATFLISRLVMDLYLSMLGEVRKHAPSHLSLAKLKLEVLWVLLSFSWGLVNLLRVRAMADGGDDNWSFGQVVPLVLLAAPLLTVSEFLFHRGIVPRMHLGTELLLI
jgi:hypothetical protein